MCKKNNVLPDIFSITIHGHILTHTVIYISSDMACSRLVDVDNGYIYISSDMACSRIVDVDNGYIFKF